MEKMQLVVDSRVASTKGAARRLRRDGKIPAILYGEGEPKPFSVDAKLWSTRFRNVSGNTIVSLKNGEKNHDVLIKDVQDDIVSGMVQHIDFYAIHAGQKLHIQVPIHLEGSPAGVREGGILEQKIEGLEVVCLPKNLPDYFSLDISHLGIGESLHVREISVPEGVEVRTEENLTVVMVSHANLEDLSAENDEALDAEDSSTDQTGAEG